MASRSQTVVCPQCHKRREVRGNTAPKYERLCRRCNAKESAARQKMSVVLDGSTPVQAPARVIYQAPCIEGKAHWWYIPTGPGSEYCYNGCGQKMPAERWTWEHKDSRGLPEKHPYLPAWGLYPALEVNTW